MRMSNQIHHNPIVSIFFGAFGGIYSLMQTHTIDFSDFYELLRVLSFGFIGGMVGYFGKIVAERWHKWLKEQAKNKCK